MRRSTRVIAGVPRAPRTRRVIGAAAFEATTISVSVGVDDE
jgi:hypothetical protein